jgi:hypothetical protein
MKARMLVGMLALAVLVAATAGFGQAQGPGLENRPQPGRTADPAGAADAAQRWGGTTIPYAGRLDNGAGQPVAEGAYDFTFALYAAEAGGEPLWSEVQAGVTVKGGAFSVSLGSVTPIPPALLDGQNLWLAVGVRGPGEAGFTALTPRQRVSAAAPAANAACPHDHFGELWSGSTASDGLWIYNSGTGDGLQVDSEGSNGVLVYHAGSVGVQVYEAGNDGVYVGSAGDDGVYVNEAGSPSATEPSSYPNGFEVAGAEGSGLYVGHADLDGVTVDSAEWYGLYVLQADSDGVRVDSAGANGVIAVSNNATNYGGLFRNVAAGGAGLYAAGGDNAAPDLVLGVYGNGDDGRIYSWPELTGSDILLFSNDEAHVHLDEDNNSDSAFVIYNGANTAVWTMTESGAAAFGTDAGAYGPRATYAVRATGDWIEDFGTAQLAHGQATVTVEPVFAQMVSLTEYQVFLTPLGDCPLYIAAKTPGSFTVRAMGGQKCGIAFDYRLVAKRLGNEDARLEPADTGGEEEED